MYVRARYCKVFHKVGSPGLTMKRCLDYVDYVPLDWISSHLMMHSICGFSFPFRYGTAVLINTENEFQTVLEKDKRFRLCRRCAKQLKEV